MKERPPVEMNTGGLEPWGGLLSQAGPRAGQAEATIAGIPYDLSAFYRPGAAAAPEHLRRLSSVIPAISESGVTMDLRLHDVGDAPVEAGR